MNRSVVNNNINFIICFWVLIISNSIFSVNVDQDLKTQSSINDGFKDYTIQPGDVIKITVLGEDDLYREVRVSANGKFSYPLLGEVDVLNKTAHQVELWLTKLLDEYLVEPQVTVFISQFGKVFVTGQVVKPGAFEYNKKITILEAITMAGGLSQNANSKKIKIIRQKGGQETSMIIDLTEVTEKGKKEKDVELIPGDVVFVPESFL